MLGLLLRFILALGLVFATWNPSGYCYADWLRQDWPDISAAMAFCGVVLLIGWVLFLHATLESLGLVGILLATAFFGTLTWLLFDQEWLRVSNGVIAYVALVVLAAILTLGMAWSHIWRRWSGQVDIDEEGTKG